MNNELVKINHPIALPDTELSLLADKIVQEIEEGRRALAISISETIKTTYWRIGRHIVEFEQDGNKRAKYGTAMLSNLAKILRARVGRGYSHPNLNNMRKFYLMFPNFQTSDKSLITKSSVVTDELQVADNKIDIHHSICIPNAVEFPVEDFFKRQRKKKSFEIIVPLWQRT